MNPNLRIRTDDMYQQHAVLFYKVMPMSIVMMLNFAQKTSEFRQLFYTHYKKQFRKIAIKYHTHLWCGIREQ